MIMKSTQFSLWLQCILFDNKLSIYLSIYLVRRQVKTETFETVDQQMHHMYTLAIYFSLCF